MRNVIVFGATESAKNLYQEIAKDYNIIKLCDNDTNKWGGVINGIEIIPPKDIFRYRYDYIAIISISSMDLIKKQLVDLGIEECCILTKYIENKVKAREIFLRNFANMVYTSPQKYDGCVAEAGVFQGEFAKHINKVFPDRKCYLFDTFEGFDKKDVEIEKQNGYSKAKENHLNITSEDMVLKKMPYQDKIIIRKGYFPDTAKNIEDKFVFVNLDMDLYKPTLEGLKFFWPRMVKGGIILVHDFFSIGYEGVNCAVRDFLENTREAESRCFPIGDDMSIAFIK